MIKAINLPSLRNNEFLQFNTDVVNRCERFDLNVLKLTEPVAQVKTAAHELELVYNKDTRSEMTEKMATSDGLRDSDLVGIRTVCEGYTYSRDPQVADAAKRILASIDRHGPALARLNYQAQTTVVDAIINDWESQPGLQSDLELVGLAPWSLLLKEENKNFNNLYQLRVDDKLDTPGTSFTSLRGDVLAAYRTLCDTIFAHGIISNDAQYTRLADAINLIIDDYQALLDRRVTLKPDTTED